MEQRDPINHVVDILLSPNQQKDAEDLEKKKVQLDKLFNKLCNERAQDFNNILFSVRPLEHQLNELASYVDGMQKSSKVLRDELLSQTNLFTFRQLEYKSLYYQELSEGLQIFEKIERMIEEVEFLYKQHNLLAAAIQFQKLRKFLFESGKSRKDDEESKNKSNEEDEIDIKQLLQEFGVFEMIRKRVNEKQRILQDMIAMKIIEFLFVTNTETIRKKIKQIMEYFEPRFKKLETNEAIIDYICQDFNELKKVKEQLGKIHKKESECAQKAEEMINLYYVSPDESVAMGLTLLQKDFKKAIEEQNVAFLVILVHAYRKVTHDPLQEFIRKSIDSQTRNLFERIIKVLIEESRPMKKQRNYYLQKSDPLTDLLQIDISEIKKVALMFQGVFLFLQANLGYFMLIDKIEITNNKESGISLDFVNHNFYYFKFMIQILVDHDVMIRQYNMKNGFEGEQQKPLISSKFEIEKNTRFSMKSKEEKESFLEDQTRMKLDFNKRLDELMVPNLFLRNISFVVTLSGRLMYMIEGIVDVIAENFNQDSDKKLEIKGQANSMKRFIITNYDFFLDNFKYHCDTVAQKYFNKAFDNSTYIKTGKVEQSQMLLRQSSQNQANSAMAQASESKQSLAQFSRASIIGRINSNQNDPNSMWAIFEFIKSFSYLSQLAVERIPQDEKDKNKQGIAQFRQDVLESVNKIMKKMNEKVSQLLNLCFNSTHRDVYFPSQLYTSERKSYFFKGIIRQEEVKISDHENDETYFGVEDQDVLYQPTVEIQNELLSTSMTTLTLLLQVYQRLKEESLNEFQASYQYIVSEKIWEQLLTESCKKEYSRNLERLQANIFDILIFLRCEFASRVFSHLKEMTKVDFIGAANSSSKLEPFAQSMIRDIKILINFVSEYLSPLEVFYLVSNASRLVFSLYGSFVRFIRRQDLDETGFDRLRKTYIQLKLELELLLPKLLSELSGSSKQGLKRIVDEMKQEIEKERQRVEYILQLITSDNKEFKSLVHENIYQLDSLEIQDLARINRNYQDNLYRRHADDDY